MNVESKHVNRKATSIILDIMRTVISIMVFVAVIAGCRGDDPPKALPDDPSKALPQARTMFGAVHKEFKKQKEEYYQAFGEGKNALLTFKKAIKTAQDADAEFAKVHAKWERIEAEVKQLHEKFANLVKGADSLFAQLNTRASYITDDQLRTKTLHVIKLSKEKYIIQLKQSKNGVNKLDDLNRMVRDTMTALEISYTLEVLEEKLTKVFQEIDTMVEVIMKELEELSRESESLLAKKFG